MKKMMTLALAGVSLFASAQASAALVIEFTGSMSTDMLVFSAGAFGPVNSSYGLDGNFSGYFTAVVDGGYGLLNGLDFYDGISPASQHSTNPINFNFKVNGLPAYATAPTNGWVALPGTGSIYFVRGATYSGNFTVYSGVITGARYRVYDSPGASPYDWAFNVSVPEPSTWAMMIAGFGIAGTALRRRKTAISFA
jgi:hypothetical protein